MSRWPWKNASQVIALIQEVGKRALGIYTEVAEFALGNCLRLVVDPPCRAFRRRKVLAGLIASEAIDKIGTAPLGALEKVDCHLLCHWKLLSFELCRQRKELLPPAPGALVGLLLFVLFNIVRFFVKRMLAEPYLIGR
jgi:hypothetical protein